TEFEVDGLRADIVLHKTARALAALDGRSAVTAADIRAAAVLALPHRQRRRPFEQPRPDRERLEESLSRLGMPKDRGGGSESSNSESAGQSEGPRDGEKGDPSDQVFAPTAPQPVRRIEVVKPAGSDTPARGGRRNPTPAGARGHYVRAVAD